MNMLLGIDIGGTNFRAARVDDRGRIRSRLERPMRRSVRPVELAEQIAAAGRDLGGGFQCAGAGVPSPLDRSRRVMRHAVNLPRFRNVPFASILRRKLRMPVIMENDANVAAWGEYVRGAGRNRGSLALYTLGTGVGGGLVIDGHLVTGDGGFASEVGHIKVDPEGLRCGCGRRGCVEAYAGARAIVSMARARGCRVDDAESVFKLARRGNRRCRAIIDQMIRALAASMATLAHLFNPGTIALAGGMSRAGASWIQAVRREAKRRMFPGVDRGTKIVRSKLDPDAGLIGAALWARKVTQS